MNILLLSEIFPPRVGGSGRWFWEIYSRMDRDGCVIAAGTDPLAGEFDKTHDLHCLRWPLASGNWGISSLSSLKYYLRLLRLLRKAIMEGGIGAIHCGRGLPEGLLAFIASKLYDVPYLCYIHGEELPTYHSSREYKYLSRLVYSSAGMLIVNSANTRKSVLEHTGISDGVVVMNPGVDTGYFTPVAKDEKVRRGLGWQGHKVILTVGRLQKRKGHDHVIRALPSILAQVPDVLYCIIGEGEERPFLEALVIAENLQESVQFLGKVDDDTMLACYQQCDLFVLANREVDGDFEGFGMVLVEAQACGKPVVTGNSGGTAETIMRDKSGLVVDTDDPESIAESVARLLRDDEALRLMGTHAAQWAQSRFDWSTLVPQARELFSRFSLKKRPRES